jgi:hypothetical protein
VNATEAGTFVVAQRRDRIAVVGGSLGLAALVALLHAVPVDGTMPLRVGAAGVLVLLLPGALILRALHWPESIAVAVAGSLLLSTAVAAVSLAAAFLVNGSFTVALVVGGTITLVALGLAALGPPMRLDRSDVPWLGAVSLAVLPLATIIGLRHTVVRHDNLFHLGRVVKLEQLPELTSLASVGEFRDGGLHPGYAFPVWHAVTAAIARLGGVDGSLVILHLGQVLAPVAVVLAYGVGRMLFNSRFGGVATAVLQLAVWSYEGTRSPLWSAADPETASRALLVPALIVLLFAYVDEGERRLLAPIAAGALALAFLHANYAPYLLLVLAGYVGAELAVNRSGRPAVRLAVPAALVAVAAAAYMLSTWPVIADLVTRSPGADTLARDFTHFSRSFEGTPESFRQAPGAIARGGAVIAGLLCLPLVAVLARRRFGAFAAGGSLAILVLVLTPALFTPFAELTSLSQARRLTGFLPVAVALAAGAVLAGRLRLVGVTAVAVLGTALGLLYPEQQTYQVLYPGPGWVAWVALGGGFLGLAWAAWKRPWGPDATRWTVAAAVALAAPLLAASAPPLERQNAGVRRLTAGLVEQLRELEPGRETVFASPRVSYRVAAAAPVYIASAPLSHVAQTRENRVFARLDDGYRFFSPGLSSEERLRMLGKYGAGWVVVFRRRESIEPAPASFRCVYADRRYILYRWEGDPASSDSTPKERSPMAEVWCP